MQDVLNRAANPWRVPKVQKIFEQLGALANRQKMLAQQSVSAQTVSDDAAVSADKQASIVQQEELVRRALGMFGISYDSLIAMDGKSSYSQAVAAQPDLAKQVVGADVPVLAALKVAVDYQPYAEFAVKYGSTPEDIKKNLQAEIQQVAPAEAAAPAPDTPAPRPPVGPVFSAYAGGSRAPGTARGGKGKRPDLASLFGR
jgi:hypothetical protein